MTTEYSVADLTNGSLSGDGVFDQLMASVGGHLRNEYDAGRITGSDYAQAYVSLVNATMNQSIQFMLQKDLTAKQVDLTAEQINTQVEQTRNVANEADVTKERGGFR